jgi:hypothetical protein
MTGLLTLRCLNGRHPMLLRSVRNTSDCGSITRRLSDDGDKPYCLRIVACWAHHPATLKRLSKGHPPKEMQQGTARCSHTHLPYL